MIDRSHELPITSQARALNISRSGVYYRPRAVPAADLAIMRRMESPLIDLSITFLKDMAGYIEG